MKMTKEELIALAMEPPEDQDVYYCNLPLMKKYATEWMESHPRWKRLRILIFLSFVVSAFIIWFGLDHSGNGTGLHGQLPLHLSIWASVAVIWLVTNGVYKICKPPFKGIHSVRIQLSDQGFHYIYQIGMHLNSYFIPDDEIKKIVYDGQAHAMYIEGRGRQVRIKRNGADETELDHIYVLMPYDKYDVADMLDPYGDLAEMKPGTLREKFAADGR